MDQQGVGYPEAPTISVTAAPAGGVTATVEPVMSAGKVIDIQFTNAGAGYTVAPTIGFSGLSTTGIGTYIYNEIVTGQTSGVEARVRDFKKRTDINATYPPIDLKVSLNSGQFYPGETLVGGISSARYIVESYSTDSVDDAFDSNAEIELEADNLLDFTEGNPFGQY